MLPLLLATALQTSWAEQTLAQMSLEEKVGQLFIVPACPLRGEDHRKDLRNLIDKYHIGGVILKQGDPNTQVALINALTSSIPLLRVADAEWGVSMRLKNALKFPRNLTLGAIQDLSLISRFGQQVGWECAQVGIDLNFAPVADVNINPLNPIIGTRSFGQDPEEVAARALLVMLGMQKQGVYACAKHFPGHGNTHTDSHVDLPVIHKLELTPFKTMANHGVAAIMTAHLYYEPEKEIVTFSRKLVSGILRDEWRYDGLIVTDALNMAALSKHYRPDEIALKALFAGHDLLLWGDHISDAVDHLLHESIPQAIEALVVAAKIGTIPQEMLDDHVLRILKAKEAHGPKTRFPKPENLASDNGKALKKELYRNAVTLVSNSLLPLKPGTPISIVQFGSGPLTFAQACSKYATSRPKDSTTIVALYDVSPPALAFIQSLQQPYIVVLFASPFKLLSIGNHPTLLVAYENDPDAEEAAADVIFGQLEAKGVLPLIGL
jgi:beta-glucosidase-like glycosyl hydrolase